MSTPRLFRASLLALTLLLAAHAQGGVADFENFNEGDFFSSFTDPVSGITFDAITGPNFVFTIDFTESRPELPTTSPGNVLGAGGFGPGPGLSLPFEFGFRGTLPSLADQVSLAVVYATDEPKAPSLTLQALSSSGDVVASASTTPPSGAFIETSIQVNSPTVNIASFRLIPENLFLAYDNITFVPEPGMGVWIAPGAIVFARRMRKVRPLSKPRATQ